MVPQSLDSSRKLTFSKIVFVWVVAGLFSYITYDEQNHQASWGWFLIGAGIAVLILVAQAFRKKGDNVRLSQRRASR